MTDPISRRRFLGVAGAGLAAAAVNRRLPRASADPSRPNILWLVTEDNSPLVGAYGDPVARTPTIDALAASGVRFDTACSTAPVCAPSRFAILTGMHAESCGPAEHMRAQGNIPEWLRGFPSYLREAGYYTTNNFKTDYNAPIDNARAGWDASGPNASWRNRPMPDTPFFAVFNFDTTHETSMFAALPVTVTNPADVRIPAYLPDTPITRADRARNYDVMQFTDQLIAMRLQELEDAGLADNTIVFYYGDHGGLVPRSKRFCYDSGLRVPLIVHFPSRWAHLAPGQPGSSIATPVSLIDLAPTVLSLAGIPLPDHLQGTAFAGPDRGARSYTFSARNRMDERYDHVRTARDERFRYIRNAMPHLPLGQHVLFMWGQASYRDWEQRFLAGELNEVQSRFWRAKPAEEMYDLHADPDEVHNLATDPAYAEVLDRMRAALDAHMLAINDNGFVPEAFAAEGYDASRAPGAYPLAELMALSAAAAERDPSNLAMFGERLTHATNAIVRYWAALGFVMLAGSLHADHLIALQTVLETDDVVQVRIAAAEALARAGVADPAVPFLAGVIDGDFGVRERLQALNALTYVGELARAALPSIARAAADPDEYVHNAGKYLLQRLTNTYVPMP